MFGCRIVDLAAGVRLWSSVNRALQLIKLNARVARLAVSGRWLGTAEIADGYNRAAATYDSAWQQHLRPVTDELLARLPGDLTGTIVDLGSGTGYASKHLAQKNPEARVIAVDISPQMLEVAQQNPPANLSSAVADMIGFLKERESGSVAMMVSTWALGYSNYPRLFRECRRVLNRNGTFAFIVNFADTLRPIFSAFSECMIAHPDRVRFAAWPRFPRSWFALEKALLKADLSIEFHKEGRTLINPPEKDLIRWLERTGILSGFHQMLDLSGPAARTFEEFLERGRHEIFHHYAMAIAHPHS